MQRIPEQTSLIDGFAIDKIDLSELAERKRSQIGPFQIEKKIGSGGMGNVYLAHRVTGGFEQTVALKLIKFGMRSETEVHRFETERNILARLQHPNIFKVGGRRTNGRQSPLVCDGICGG
ncbi:MAG: protein kinase [Balneolaceae bacterium]|nr:protein kinase [Balneolaceae bacterium]